MTTRKPFSTASASTGAEVVALPTAGSISEDEVLAAKQRAKERDLEGWVNWLARPEKKIAIVGFTKSRELAPWDDPSFNIWICNNLWRFCPDKWHRLYDLHDVESIRSDREHEAYLRTTAKPVIVWNPRPEWPASEAYPKEAITASMGRYFSNSISWMVAHAIYEGATEIHVYGVDMAQGGGGAAGEYASQRPSCEYFLGLAAGRGVKVYVPPQSDLLKVSAMYGVESDSALRIKLEEREKELAERMNQLQGQRGQLEAQLNQIAGALENTKYFKTVWTNPRGQRDGAEAPEALAEKGA